MSCGSACRTVMTPWKLPEGSDLQRRVKLVSHLTCELPEIREMPTNCLTVNENNYQLQVDNYFAATTSLKLTT